MLPSLPSRRRCSHHPVCLCLPDPTVSANHSPLEQLLQGPAACSTPPQPQQQQQQPLYHECPPSATAVAGAAPTSLFTPLGHSHRYSQRTSSPVPAPIQTQQQYPASSSPAASHAQSPPPPQSDSPTILRIDEAAFRVAVGNLVDMGFTQEHVLRAMTAAYGEPDLAFEYLTTVRFLVMSKKRVVIAVADLLTRVLTTRSSPFLASHHCRSSNLGHHHQHRLQHLRSTPPLGLLPCRCMPQHPILFLLLSTRTSNPFMPRNRRPLITTKHHHRLLLSHLRYR